jgi:RNA polymerase sigma-70 factor (ECF subfamily)
MLGDQESARDLVQETLLAAHRALPRWQPPAMPGTLTEGDELSAEQRYLVQHPLEPWLYRIATNLALTYLKSRTKITRNHAPIMLQKGREDLQGQSHSALDLEERFATRELLREALGHLSPEDAACLLLRFVDGERYAEIATRLDISAEAVRKRVGRGLIMLRAVYRQLDREVSP